MKRSTMIVLIAGILALIGAASVSIVRAGWGSAEEITVVEFDVSEDMTRFVFDKDVAYEDGLPKDGSAFITRGVRKLRLTGGEPLVRRGIMTLFSSLSRHLASGALDELTLTTNGSQLPKYAAELAGLGVRRINVSLDTLDPDKFRYALTAKEATAT